MDCGIQQIYYYLHLNGKPEDTFGKCGKSEKKLSSPAETTKTELVNYFPCCYAKRRALRIEENLFFNLFANIIIIDDVESREKDAESK